MVSSAIESPDHPFNGIFEKLKRANQNIVNLKSEIDTFIQKGKYPTIPHPDDKLWQEAATYHRDKIIPLRFSVLSGETIHHLRSILDHIVWHFSSEVVRRDFENVIEFPVLELRPSSKDKPRRYDRKIQGITNLSVIKLIAALQPYRAGADAADQPICIIHNMDRFDKHRELAIVDSCAVPVFAIPPHRNDLVRKVVLYSQGKLPEADRPAVGYAIKNYANITPNVAFRKFGKREDQPVIPGLTQLADYMRDVVSRFGRFI
jgi:hypothetical protein